MTQATNFTPAGYHSITPYLVISGAAKAIDFYKNVFGASVLGDPFLGPDGTVGHAELQIGDSRIMVADEFPGIGAVSPKTVGGSPIGLCLYVKDVDATVKLAVELGSKVTRPIADQFYGDRSGQLEDPFGHKWTIATHVEDVTSEEMHRRAAALYGGQ